MRGSTVKRFARGAVLGVLVPMVFGVSCGGGDAGELAMFDGPPATDIEPASTEGKEDGLGSLGPTVGGHASTSVWSVENQWEDRDTSAARAAGLAWGEDSGLSWEEKFNRWVASLETTESERGGTTFQVTNPWGATLPAPVLECAEVAYFLRASFAAWYNLPFFVQARDSQGAIYLGHFGFIRQDGSRYGNSPRYSRLSDFSDGHPHGRLPATWPSDSRLASRGLYGGGDEVPFLGEGARAGAYFDAMFLNKRVGYFLLTLLAYFGSMHLADTTITFHLQPEAIQPGDVLLERWQRSGIGHTIPVMRVEEMVPGRFEVAVASGSMPRRQPVWEDSAAARRYFTNDMMGGHGTNSDDEAYAALGGGLRRWRIAINQGGRWQNTIPRASREHWINSSDLESIAARVDRFAEILAQVTPEEQREVLIDIIASKRDHLSRYPASCAARIVREEAFESLYELMETEWDWTRARVDAEYRTLADYVFAELAYNESRTCCWNSSTADMYRIVMDYNRELQADGCAEPVVFMMRDGGYEVFRDFAESRGEDELWQPWSADESCPQASTVTTDTEAEHDWTPFCELDEIDDSDPPPPVGCEDGNDDTSTATALAVGADPLDAEICSGDEDFYRFTIPADGQVTATLTFTHADGDLDAELLDVDGAVLRSSSSSNDDEVLELDLDAGDYGLRVYGYQGAENDYTVAITFTEDDGGGSPDGNDSLETAEELASGASITAAIDESGDVDFYRVNADTTHATLTFTHADGDLDLELLDADGASIHTSQGTSDTEIVEGSGAAPLFLRVYGYSSATGDYSLTLR